MKRLHTRLAVSIVAVCVAIAACGGGRPSGDATPAAAPQGAAAAAPAPAAAAPAPAAAAAAAPAATPAVSPSPAATGTSGPDAAPAPPPSARAAKRAAPAKSAAPESAPHADATPPPVAAAATPVVPPPPPAPRFRDVTIPAGTTLALKLTTPLASDQNKVEDAVTATLSSPVSVDGVTVLPHGAEVNGTVLDVKPSGRVKGLASIAFRFDRVHAPGETHTIVTDRITREAQSTKGKDAAKVGIGSGPCSLIVGIAGGGKGAAIGSIVGGGAGAGAVAATKGEEVRLPPGTPVTATLREPLVIRVRVE
jgi:hypothetical protein